MFKHQLKETTDFWYGWDYDEDFGMWTKFIANLEIRYYSPIQPDLIPLTFRLSFIHYSQTEIIVEKAWEVIRALPVQENEQGKQNWEFSYLQIVPTEVNKIRVAFHENNFDIYRETHVLLEKKDEYYKFIDIIYEIA